MVNSEWRIQFSISNSLLTFFPPLRTSVSSAVRSILKRVLPRRIAEDCGGRPRIASHDPTRRGDSRAWCRLAATVHSELVEPVCGARSSRVPCKNIFDQPVAPPGVPVLLSLPIPPDAPHKGAAKVIVTPLRVGDRKGPARRAMKKLKRSCKRRHAGPSRADGRDG